MATLEVLLFIFFIVVIVTAIAENINVPYPILLVIAGLLVGLIPNMPNWQPPDNIILALFLPPILFSAARTISGHDIKQNLTTIFSLSFALVILTAFTIALVLYWTIPNMTLATALVLGAIFSPTDIVAAHSILSKLNVNQNIINIIKVESLFNDACGIFLYKAALLLVLSQSFSASYLSFHTLFIGIGGILIGIGFAYISNVIVTNILSPSKNDLPIIMSIILAYISYLFAQHVGASSVLAVVSAGLFHKRTVQSLRANTRLAEKTIWDTLLFFLNGLIFISIGLEFPYFLEEMSYLPAWDIILFSSITITAILVLRFAWVTLTNYLNQYLHHKKQSAQKHAPLDWRANSIITWSGMRGLVSLALALALPLTDSHGAPFPERDLIIFLTIITILFTLVGQGLTLPWLIKLLRLRKHKNNDIHATQELYQQLSQKALDNIDYLSQHPQMPPNVARRLVENHYTNRLLGLKSHHEITQEEQVNHQQAELLLARSLQFERDLLLRMYQQGEITEAIFLKVLQKLDRDEVNFTHHH